jgi:RNA-directed DNA polymerase
MNTAIAPRSQWTTRGWVNIDRQVLKLHNRRYRAAKRGEHRQVRRLQSLWLRSRAATLVAVRHVTRENHGKQTPGVEGVAHRTPHERLALGQHLHLEGHASPGRRGSMPTPGTTAPRPLGMPTLADRATHAAVRHVLEPAWEAQCEPNSDGFRPGRSPWEALGAIDVQSHQQPNWGLEADLAQGCERSNHEALVRTLEAPPPLSRQITAWRQVGLRDTGAWCPTAAGPPPGGPASPLFANVALPGREEAITRAFAGRGRPAVVRDAAALLV